jgi:SAM-dependent methyltransferase
MPDETGYAALDAQKQHWEGMLGTRPDMFGSDPSEPARRSAAEFEAAGVHRILELGGGQGRDSLFFAGAGFDVHVLDYAQAGVDAILRKASQAGLGGRVTAAQHDVRRPLPVADESFDACYSHMLFCMAFTAAELEALAREVRRALEPGGLCVLTVRNTSDPDYGLGIRRGEDLFENQGFIVHFFDRATVERVAKGYEIVGLDEFEEGKLPRRLFRVTLRRPSR